MNRALPVLLLIICCALLMPAQAEPAGWQVPALYRDSQQKMHISFQLPAPSGGKWDEVKKQPWFEKTMKMDFALLCINFRQNEKDFWDGAQKTPTADFLDKTRSIRVSKVGDKNAPLQNTTVHAGKRDMLNSGILCLHGENLPTGRNQEYDWYLPIGTMEVNAMQYAAVMGLEPPTTKLLRNAMLPQTMITRAEARQFADKLTKLLESQHSKPDGTHHFMVHTAEGMYEKEGILVSSISFGLPTSAEWEFAARGAETVEQTVYDNNTPMQGADNETIYTYEHCAGESAVKVDGRDANCVGLHDMLGNVFEWVEDSDIPRGGYFKTDLSSISPTLHGENFGSSHKGKETGFRLVMRCQVKEATKQASAPKPVVVDTENTKPEQKPTKEETDEPQKEVHKDPPNSGTQSTPSTQNKKPGKGNQPTGQGTTGQKQTPNPENKGTKPAPTPEPGKGKQTKSQNNQDDKKEKVTPIVIKPETGGGVGMVASPLNFLTRENLKDIKPDVLQLLLASARKGKTLHQYYAGICLLEGYGKSEPNKNVTEGEKKQAAEFFRKAAEQKHPAAQCNLALCYDCGYGVTQNQKEALKLYTMAANQGNAEAQFNLGIYYAKGIVVAKDMKKAVQFYEQAARYNLPNARGNLGVCYLNGDGVEKNPEKAVSLFRQAAQQGHKVSQYNLGLCYAIGLGVSKNIQHAVQLWEMAANQNHAEAQCKLGLCYESGRGVPRNAKKAVEYYKLAADQKLPEAQELLGECYEEGRGGCAKNIQKALSLYKEAAAQQNADALFRLGRSYAKGLAGGGENMAKAIEYYELAAKQNHPKALFNLALCHESGKGVPKNPAKAVEFYERAAALDNELALCILGEIYEHGDAGVTKDLKKAAQYYERAAKRGLAEAEYATGRCYLNGIGVSKNFEKARDYLYRAAEQKHYRALKDLAEYHEKGIKGFRKNKKEATRLYKLANEAARR